MSKRGAARTHPAHADVWLRAPVWTSRKQRLAVAGVIVAAALGSLGGAGVTARRVDAAVQHPAGSSSANLPPEGTRAFGAPLVGDLGLPGTSSPVGLPSTSWPSIPGHTADPTPSGPLAPELAGDGIPAVALDAYRKAAAAAPAGCGIPWPLLAAIGRVESDHGRFADSQLYADGTSAPRVIGIPLNGNGTALITDTDGGRLDGDTTYDRAVGPMQFIPSTWASWGVDGNGDGVASPFNIYDAARASADYLCSAGGNLRTADGQIRAVLAYNHSDAYLATVLSLEKAYASGIPGVTIPLLPSAPKPPRSGPPLPPPVDPGRPLGVGPHKPKPSHKPSTPPSHPTTPPSSSPPTAPGIPTGTGSTTPPICPTDTTPPPTTGSTPTPDPTCTTTPTDPPPTDPPPPTDTTSASAADTSTPAGTTAG